MGEEFVRAIVASPLPTTRPLFELSAPIRPRDHQWRRPPALAPNESRSATYVHGVCAACLLVRDRATCSDTGRDSARARWDGWGSSRAWIGGRCAPSDRGVGDGGTVAGVQVDLLFDPFGGRSEDLRTPRCWPRAPASTGCGCTTTSPGRCTAPRTSSSAGPSSARWLRRSLAWRRLAGAQRRQPGRRHARGDGGHAAGGERGTAAARGRCRRWRARRTPPSKLALGRAVPGDAARRGAVEATIATLRQVWSGAAGAAAGFLRPIPASRHRRRLRPEDGRARRAASVTASTHRRGRRCPPDRHRPEAHARSGRDPERSSSRRRARPPTSDSPASACIA